MGELAKRLGQLATRSLETQSANILRTAAANKRPGSLSLLLDGTLRKGHDMKTFGLGTAASMASVERYRRFTWSMALVYAEMERQLDAATAAGNAPVGLVWSRHGAFLRRAPRLAADLADVGASVDGGWDVGLAGTQGQETADKCKPSKATSAYLEALRRAGEDDVNNGRSSGRLLGHLYCRYFADLFGGQMLGGPTRAALDLPQGTPRHYNFDFGAVGSRRAVIEAIYEDINAAGDLLVDSDNGNNGDTSLHDVVDEALKAFDLNVGVYAEEGRLWSDGARGLVRMAIGTIGGLRTS